MGAMGRGENLDLEGASGPLDFDSEGDILTTDILRWDLASTTRDFIECEAVSRYNDDNTVERFWCNVQCIPNLGEKDNCEPDLAPIERSLRLSVLSSTTYFFKNRLV